MQEVTRPQDFSLANICRGRFSKPRINSIRAQYTGTSPPSMQEATGPQNFSLIKNFSRAVLETSY